MKFTCTKKDLLEALGVVSKAVAPVSADQMMLSMIYLYAHDTVLEIHANNFELGIIDYIPATVDTPGKAALSGKYLQEVTRKLPDDIARISLDSESHLVTIKSGAANFTLLSSDAEKFPVVEKVQGELDFEIHNEIFIPLVKQTILACSTSDSRPIFTGGNFKINGKNVSLSATDTHQLAIKTDEIKEPADTQGEEKSLVIPAKTLLGVMKDCSVNGSLTDIHIVSDYKQIGFEFDNIYVRSRLIEGKFPPLDNVIPREFTTEVTVRKDYIMNATDRVALISRSDELRIVTLDFHIGELHISSNSKEIGSAEEVIPIKLEGNELKIAFDSRFLINALKSVTGDFCRISMSEPLKPMLVREKENENLKYIITPVRNAE